METTTEKVKSLLTIKQAAREYDFPEYGLRNKVKAGAFAVIKCGNRVYINRQVFEDYLLKGDAV